MLPFYKLLSLVIRVFSRPIINYTKRVHLNSNANQSERLRRFFIWFGNFYHRCEIRINRRFLKIQSQIAHKPLNNQLAVQKGIDFFFEVIFYVIVIGLPIYQLVRGNNQAKQKSQKLQDRLKSIESKLQQLIAQKQSTLILSSNLNKQQKLNLKQQKNSLQKILIKSSVQQKQLQISENQLKQIDSKIVLENWNKMLILNAEVLHSNYKKIMITNAKDQAKNLPKIQIRWIPLKIWIQSKIKRKTFLL